MSASSIALVLETGRFELRGEAIGFSLSAGVLAPIYSLTALTCALV